jgi:hypothetical protein
LYESGCTTPEEIMRKSDGVMECRSSTCTATSSVCLGERARQAGDDDDDDFLAWLYESGCTTPEEIMRKSDSVMECRSSTCTATSSVCSGGGRGEMRTMRMVMMVMMMMMMMMTTMMMMMMMMMMMVMIHLPARPSAP